MAKTQEPSMTWQEIDALVEKLEAERKKQNERNYAANAPSPGMRPSIDHGMLSPSGKASKRGWEALQEREAKRLKAAFNAYSPQVEEIPPSKAIKPLRQASLLIKLANSGMATKKYTKAANKELETAISILKEEQEDPACYFRSWNIG